MAFKGPGLGEVIGNLRERMMNRLFGDIISERVYNATQVVDDEYWSQIRGGAPTLDEDWNARKENLDDALDAWRSNPLARRIVSLCTDYVVGPGIVLQRDRVEALLTDSGNAEWSTGELDNALRLALYELSSVLPVRASATVDAVDSTWEYSLSSITGLVTVVEVWYPYVAASRTYRLPHPVKFRMLTDAVLLLEVDDTPDDAYDLRIFYDKVQTLAGLDSASSTTLDDARKAALVIGTAGYAAIGKARDVTNEVTIGAEVPGTLEKWGKARLTEFQERIVALAAAANAGEDSRVGWGAVDKWDGGN